MSGRLRNGIVGCLAAGFLVAATPAHALTRCDLHFDLEGWSVFYKQANGNGVVDCDNGQRTHVRIETRGGGVTFGRSSIVGGSGDFSPVGDIHEIFGNYANVEAHAGMGVSSGAQVVTKGSVSLALSGTGTGVDLGVAFGRFTIAPGGHDAREEDLPAEQPLDELRTERAAPRDGY
jgi:hypothetical protein